MDIAAYDKTIAEMQADLKALQDEIQDKIKIAQGKAETLRQLILERERMNIEQQAAAYHEEEPRGIVIKGPWCSTRAV